MHPDHVAALVAGQVRALETKLAQLDLPVKEVELGAQIDLRIRFTSTTTRAIDVPSLGSVKLVDTAAEENFVLRLECDDFDSQPPLVTLLDAAEAPLPAKRWPHDPSRHGIVFGHHIYGQRNFFCRPGTREFHTHRQHEDEPWDIVREGMSIDGIALGILRDLKDRWTIR